MAQTQEIKEATMLEELKEAKLGILASATLLDDGVQSSKLLKATRILKGSKVRQREAKKIFLEKIKLLNKTLDSRPLTRGDAAAYSIAYAQFKEIIDINKEQTPGTKLMATMILNGYKRDPENPQGVIKIEAPYGLSIQNAGEILNVEAKERGLKYHPFYEGRKAYWDINEANAEFSTKPGRVYKFKLTRSYKGKCAPLGAIALAGACELLLNQKNLSGQGDSYIGGSSRGAVLRSLETTGIHIQEYRSYVPGHPVLPSRESRFFYASLV